MHTRDSGHHSITWPESVAEALCFGWIDSVRRRVDDISYTIRFTPRKSSSIWSSVNTKKMLELIADEPVHPAGLRAFERRSEEKSAIYAAARGADRLLRRTQKHPDASTFGQRRGSLSAQQPLAADEVRRPSH